MPSGWFACFMEKENPTQMMEKLFVLSGGGVRGFAHLGVVKALWEKGVVAEQISATSAGALAAAFLANGFSPDEIMEIVTGKMNLKLLHWNMAPGGLISLDKVAALLQNNLRYTRFEQLPIKLFVAATNFAAGGQKIFSTGDLIQPVLAACSIPGLFPPLFIDQVPYVDGGLSNNLPVEPFINRKKDVVAVYVNPLGPFHPQDNMTAMLDRAIHMSFREIVIRSASDCYLFVEPPGLEKFGLLDLRNYSAIFEVAYRYAQTIVLP
jgi:NTE family protein